MLKKKATILLLSKQNFNPNCGIITFARVFYILRTRVNYVNQQNLPGLMYPSSSKFYISLKLPIIKSKSNPNSEPVSIVLINATRLEIRYRVTKIFFVNNSEN
ncbi:hypothetical protein K0M31_010269 [Melipona bicolor]|uniref:Uncharacterized protein n=1 Tax=Melipona bicolor TaxID=60889 RepID=A0AA40FMH5_9HYME|nr:hypothetical protein K0M31_010269 [Melipona bicolor]